jgi:hypothetical protein
VGQDTEGLLLRLRGILHISNVLGPPSRDRLKGTTHVHNMAKTAVKVYHAEKTLQLLDALGGLTSCQGQSCRQNHVTEDFQGRDCKNAFFKVDGKTIGHQSIEESFQMFACLENQHESHPCM